MAAGAAASRFVSYPLIEFDNLQDKLHKRLSELE